MGRLCESWYVMEARSVSLFLVLGSGIWDLELAVLGWSQVGFWIRDGHLGNHVISPAGSRL